MPTGPSPNSSRPQAPPQACTPPSEPGRERARPKGPSRTPHQVEALDNFIARGKVRPILPCTIGRPIECIDSCLHDRPHAIDPVELQHCFHRFGRAGVDGTYDHRLSVLLEIGEGPERVAPRAALICSDSRTKSACRRSKPRRTSTSCWKRLLSGRSSQQSAGSVARDRRLFRRCLPVRRSAWPRRNSLHRVRRWFYDNTERRATLVTRWPVFQISSMRLSSSLPIRRTRTWR